MDVWMCGCGCGCWPLRCSPCLGLLPTAAQSPNHHRGLPHERPQAAHEDSRRGPGALALLARAPEPPQWDVFSEIQKSLLPCSRLCPRSCRFSQLRFSSALPKTRPMLMVSLHPSQNAQCGAGKVIRLSDMDRTWHPGCYCTRPPARPDTTAEECPPPPVGALWSGTAHVQAALWLLIVFFVFRFRLFLCVCV